MRVRFVHRFVLAIRLLRWFAICLAAEAIDACDRTKDCDVIREFADNLPKHGRDRTQFLWTKQTEGHGYERA